MWNKKIKLFVVGIIIVVIAAVIVARIKGQNASDEIVKMIKPSIGSIETMISSTGTVLPKNRLAIKPPVNGRIESILIKEGEKVKIGQTLAIMSSTERAALLDAARGKGEDVLKYWEEAYKPILLPSPIDGEVIVATTQPGQTVTTSDAVVVLSDHLIVRAQVDETDVGKIKLNQEAVISLDAYPGVKIKAAVGHLYYESETVNNVTIYKVDLVPENVPDFFRSGMNATVDFIVESKKDILLVPADAVYKEENTHYVLLKQEGSQNPVKRVVELGITDDKNYEVLSGVTAGDTILLTTKKYVFTSNGNSAGSNPFLPKMPTRKNRNGSSQK